MIASGGMFLVAGDGKTGFISTEDIAQVAALAFQHKRYGAGYNLTGPYAIDHAQAARINSEMTGKNTKYHPLQEEKMRQGAKDNGLPEGMVQNMANLYRAVGDGLTAAIMNDVERATGSEPISFADFVRNNSAVLI